MVTAGGVASFRSFLGNDSTNLVELAAAAMANLLHGDRRAAGRPVRSALLAGGRSAELGPLLASTCLAGGVLRINT